MTTTNPLKNIFPTDMMLFIDALKAVRQAANVDEEVKRLIGELENLIHWYHEDKQIIAAYEQAEAIHASMSERQHEIDLLTEEAD